MMKTAILLCSLVVLMFANVANAYLMLIDEHGHRMVAVWQNVGLNKKDAFQVSLFDCPSDAIEITLGNCRTKILASTLLGDFLANLSLLFGVPGDFSGPDAVARISAAVSNLSDELETEDLSKIDRAALEAKLEELKTVQRKLIRLHKMVIDPFNDLKNASIIDSSTSIEANGTFEVAKILAAFDIIVESDGNVYRLTQKKYIGNAVKSACPRPFKIELQANFTNNVQRGFISRMTRTAESTANALVWIDNNAGEANQLDVLTGQVIVCSRVVLDSPYVKIPVLCVMHRN